MSGNQDHKLINGLIINYFIKDSHYGRCNIENIVTIESDDELWIRKYFDPRTCTGHPHWTWTNVPRMQCPTGDEVKYILLYI